MYESVYRRLPLLPSPLSISAPPFSLSLFSMVSPSDLSSLWVLSLLFLCLSLVPFICQALPLATATEEVWFPIMPSIASLTPAPSLPPSLPLRRVLYPRVVGQLSPGVMRSVSPSVVLWLTPLPLICQQIRRLVWAAILSWGLSLGSTGWGASPHLSPSLFFSILLHPFLSISATSLSLTGCHSFQLSLLLCQPSIRTHVFVFLSRQEKSDFHRPNGQMWLMITKLNKWH